MPLDLKLIDKTLTPSENPGLDTLDPRFQEIAGLVEAGDMPKASEQVEALFREDILDIRVAGYYLYGVFAERGLAGLGDTLKVLARLFGENYEAMGPVKKRETHYQNGAAWFLTRVQKKLAAEEEKKGADWNTWLEKVSSDAAGAIIETCEALQKAVTARMQAPKVMDGIKKIADWLKGYQKLVYVPEKPVEKAPEPAKEVKKDDAAKPAAGAPARAGGTVLSLEQMVFDRPVAEGSFHLQELQDRLKAFETLCQKKQFEKASLAASEIGAVIEKFDPRLFFPKLFAPYATLLAQNFEEISKHWEGKEQPAWKAQEQLFRVDLQAFVGK